MWKRWERKAACWLIATTPLIGFLTWLKEFLGDIYGRGGICTEGKCWYGSVGKIIGL